MRLRLGWVVVIGLLATGCGAGHPWWYRSGISSCAPPVTILVHDATQQLGDCAGRLIEPPRTVRMSVGDQLALHVLQDADSSPIMPAPTASPSGILRALSRNDFGSTVTFQADQAGTTELVTSTPLCGRGEVRTCGVLRVVVSK